MVMLADVGGISGIKSTLGAVKVPPDVIDDIVAIITATSGELDPDAFREVPGAWFGGSGTAQMLGVHTEKAHRKLANAVLEAVAGLQTAGQAMEDFDKEISRADANSEEAALILLHRTQQALDSMDGDRHTPPPSGGGDASGSDR